MGHLLFSRKVRRHVFVCIPRCPDVCLSTTLYSAHRLQTQKRCVTSQADQFGLGDLNNCRSPSNFLLQPNDAGREPDPSQEKSQKEEPSSQELTGAATGAGRKHCAFNYIKCNSQIPSCPALHTAIFPHLPFQAKRTY